MFDALSILLGGIVGATAAILVVRQRQPAPAPPAPAQKLSSAWRLTELKDPVVVARDVADVEVGPGTTVYASGLVDPAVQQHARVHEVPSVRAEFALDKAGGRAFLFIGGVRKDAMALITSDPAMLARLESEHRRLADRAADYVERSRISELGQREGVVVETEGHAQDVLPWQGRFMIRLEDQGHIIGVAVDKDPAELVDRRLRVRGRLARDRTGYPFIEATDLRTIG